MWYLAAVALSCAARSWMFIRRGILVGLLGVSLVACDTVIEDEPPPVEDLPPADRSLADTPWPKFRGDARSTGRSVFAGPGTPDERWAFETEARIEGSPVIDDEGHVYIGSFDRTLYKLTPAGELAWTFRTDAPIASTPPLAANGTLYLASGRLLFAIEPDGTERSAVALPDLVRASPAIADDGTVYVSTVGRPQGEVVALNPDGTERWAFAAEAEITSSPAIADDGTLYGGSFDGNVYALSPEGALQWAFPTGDRVTSAPAVGDDGTVYVGSWDGSVYAIDPTGTEQWAFGTGDVVTSAPALGADGTVYVGSNDSNVYAIRPDGTERWRFETIARV